MLLRSCDTFLCLPVDTKVHNFQQTVRVLRLIQKLVINKTHENAEKCFVIVKWCCYVIVMFFYIYDITLKPVWMYSRWLAVWLTKPKLAITSACINHSFL